VRAQRWTILQPWRGTVKGMQHYYLAANRNGGVVWRVGGGAHRGRRAEDAQQAVLASLHIVCIEPWAILPALGGAAARAAVRRGKRVKQTSLSPAVPMAVRLSGRVDGGSAATRELASSSAKHRWRAEREHGGC